MGVKIKQFIQLVWWLNIILIEEKISKCVQSKQEKFSEALRYSLLLSIIIATDFLFGIFAQHESLEIYTKCKNAKK